MRITESHKAQTCKLHTNIALVYEDASDQPQTHPLQLNLSGMFFGTSKDIPVGAVLRLQFELPLSNVELIVKAKVRNSVPGSGVKVEFLDLSPEAAEAIEQELEMISAGLVPEPFDSRLCGDSGCMD